MKMVSSGKSPLMVFAAQKLRMHPKLGNPTVMIMVGRIDLDTQITSTFNASDVPNMVGVATRQELQTLLGQDLRKVLITTIHKFGEAGGMLNERSNIIVMVDEAHRTQEGDLGPRDDDEFERVRRITETVQQLLLIALVADVLLPFGRIGLRGRHHDGARLRVDQLVHHGLVEHTALAIEGHYLPLKSFGSTFC